LNIVSSIESIVALFELGDFQHAKQQAEELVHKHSERLSLPDQSELWRLLGLSHLQLGELDPAYRAIQHALSLQPDALEAWCNLASVAIIRRRPDEAEVALRKAIALAPEHAVVWNNLGSLVVERCDYRKALDYFRKAIQFQPSYAAAWVNLAGASLELREFDNANSAIDTALKLAPQHSEAHFIQANIFLAEGRKSEALNAFKHASRLNPANPHVHHQIAQVSEDLHDWQEAIRAYQAALFYDPQFSLALSQLVFLKRRLCDWSGLEILSKKLIEKINDPTGTIAPFSFLVEEATLEQQLFCAKQFAKYKKNEIVDLTKKIVHLTQSALTHDHQLRVGFFSAGFGEHPTALLIAELIEKLREKDLCTIGLTTTPDDGGVLRKRLKAAFHEFHDLNRQTLEQRIRTAQDCNLDILIDLDGYCGGSQPEFFALKPASIQINWLAFPGTLGAPWYDYLIADRFVIPKESVNSYSEKIAYLPRCFQPSDTTRTINAPPSREECGLPGSGTIFCSFNNSYKFTEKTFSKWMRILHAVPDSILWLLSGPPHSPANENLRKEAEKRGINSDRLIFSFKLPHADYLARYHHADLFLDTNPYNAHTTASDALWAGCPVLTQPGVTFASRVAGSLNYHIGLTQMNVLSDEDFVRKAIELGSSTVRLSEVRKQLEEAKKTSILFDMRGYAEDFFSLLKTLYNSKKSN